MTTLPLRSLQAPFRTLVGDALKGLIGFDVPRLGLRNNISPMSATPSSANVLGSGMSCVVEVGIPRRVLANVPVSVLVNVLTTV